MNYGGMPLRVAMIDGDPWFVARDACEVLGMDLYAGTSRWLAHIGSDEVKKVLKKEHPQIFCGSRGWSLNLLSESGLNKLIMRSSKPKAKPFQEWVSRDVLPSIRKTGSACPQADSGAAPRGLIVLL